MKKVIIAGLLILGIGAGYIASRIYKKKHAIAESPEDTPDAATIPETSGTTDIAEPLTENDKEETSEYEWGSKNVTDCVELITVLRADGYNQNEIASMLNIPKDKVRELIKLVTSAPYYIDEDDFAEGEALGYTTETLTWYSGNNTLYNEDNQETVDPNDIFGDLGFTTSSFVEGNSTTLHIRNEYLQIDYEILFSEDSYTDEE